MHIMHQIEAFGAQKKKISVTIFGCHFPKWRPNPIWQPIKPETLIVLTKIDRSDIVIHQVILFGLAIFKMAAVLYKF